MDQCLNCQHALKKPRFKKRCWFTLEKYAVVLENVRVAYCCRCRYDTFYFNLQQILGAIVRELIDFPAALSGRQLGWIVHHLTYSAEQDGVFAEWLGFHEQYKLMRQRGWSFTDKLKKRGKWDADAEVQSGRLLLEHARQLVAEKLELKSYDDLKTYFRQDYLSDDLDKKVREMLKWLPKMDRYSSRTEFINEKYVIFVNLQPTAQT